MQKPIEQMTVPELRREASARGLGSGGWRACAGRDTLLSALRGESIPDKPAAPAGGGLDALLAAAIEPHLAERTISREEFDAVAVQAETIAELSARVKELEDNGSKAGAAVLTFDRNDVQIGRVDGLTHRQLPAVIAWIESGVPVWLWGGAGCGKTTLARQVAAALGLSVTVIPIDDTISVSRLLGFRNMATGEFVPGPLLAPYRDGGLLMLDEIDTGNPGILAALNSLLANEHYTLPDGTEYRPPADFRVMAGANTKGTGAVAGYRARQPLDAATLDRFAVVELLIDSELEMSLSLAKARNSQEEATIRRWVEYVQKVRGHGSIAKSVLISPRASLKGAASLRGGIPVAEVADSCLFALCDADTKARIVAACGAPQ